MTEITLTNNTTGWTATFLGSKTMPNGVAIPLPFTADASPKTVAIDICERFPGALVGVR